MDRITKALLDEFIQQNALNALKEDKAFEHFAGYLVTVGHYPESFSTDDICVGAGGDCGIDCISIIVNGSLVTEPEEIEDLATTNGYLDVSFVFTQAERSSGFEAAKIGSSPSAFSTSSRTDHSYPEMTKCCFVDAFGSRSLNAAGYSKKEIPNASYTM